MQVEPSQRSELIALWQEAEAPQGTGWDFSALRGRMSEDPVPWDLDATYRHALSGAASALDMGTGGGEHLLRFADALPADTTATEGWPPNLPVAREALGRLDIPVMEFGAPDDDPDSQRMPFPDGRFDVILNRHESYSAREVARVLSPGGTFITQQVASGELPELHALLDGEMPNLDVSHDRFVREAEEVGLTVESSAQFDGWYRFADVSALIAYLNCVPWHVPDDFSVARYADALLTLHGRAAGRPVNLGMRRFWLLARRPAL